MAEYNAGTVKATMIADTSGMHGGVQSAKNDMQSLRDEAKKTKEAWKDMGLAAGVSFAAITAGIWKSVEANNQLKASMAGLDSVATGVVGSYDKIKQELQKVQEDGVIPLTNAVAAYKNLLTRYQDEDKAIAVFKRLADAAAFGRQGHLSLGEAIQGATEGLKNEMSQLVDNAGVTKNVSIMWKDYAASIGKTVGQLTDAEKRQAEYNGIMEETRFQVGDLAKLQSQLSGQMSKAAAETNMAAAAMGDALEPALGAAVSQFSGLMKGVKDFITASPGLVAGATTGALAMTGLVTASSAWIALDLGSKIAAGFSALTGPVGIAMVALSALASVIVGVTTEMRKQREEQQKQAESYRNQAKEVDGLISEYEDLSEKANKTANEKQRLVDLSNKIAEILPNAVTGYDKEGNAIISVNSALREMILLKGQELRNNQNILRDEIRSDERAKKRAEARKQELNETWNRMVSRWGSTPDKIEDPLLRRRAKELEEEYNRELRKTNDEITRLADNITNKKQQVQDIEDMLNNGRITRQTIRESGTTKSTTITTGSGGDTSAEAKERARKQAELDTQLYIERLERLKQFHDAEVEEEKRRYKSEYNLAQGNDKLLKDVKQGHIDRLKAIDDKYNQQKLDAERERTIRELQLQADLEEAQGQNLQAALDRDRAQELQELANIELTEQQKDQIKRIHELHRQNIAKQFGDQEKLDEDRKMQYLYDNHQISLQEYRDYLTKRLADYQQYSDEWIQLTKQIEDLNHQLDVQLTGVDWIQLGDDMKSALHDGLVSGLTDAIMQGERLSDVFDQLIRQILQMIAQRAIVESLVNGIMSGLGWDTYHDGGEVQSIPKAHSGMFISDTIIRAHNGLKLAPDEVPIIAQTGERILSREQNKRYEEGLTQSIDVQVNVINQTGQPVLARQQSAGFDGERYVVNVILDNVARNGELRKLFNNR